MKIKRLFASVKDIALNVLFPQVCLHCGKDLHRAARAPLCPACENKLSKINARLFCRRCGCVLKDGGAHCYHCRGYKAKIYKCAIIRSCFEYKDSARSLIHWFKYKDKPFLDVYMGKFLFDCFNEYKEFHKCDLIVAVPLSRAKLRRRGYNQAQILAQRLSGMTGIKLEKNVLKRTRNTASQISLNRLERLENVRGAFETMDRTAVRGYNILLIDDVATTTATLENCARALKRAGAASVSAFTFARE